MASENRLYNVPVARKPAPEKGPRPKQGAHLLALREAAGITQMQLAEALGVAHGNIASWEWSEKPPPSRLLPKIAEILHIRIEDLLSSSTVPTIKRTSPVGEVQKAFEEVRKLPRKQQRKIVETVYALVHEYKRKAG